MTKEQLLELKKIAERCAEGTLTRYSPSPQQISELCETVLGMQEALEFAYNELEATENNAPIFDKAQEALEKFGLKENA